MTKKEKLIDLIQDMGYSEQMILHNEYCYKINNYDNEIFDMDSFDEIFDNYTPTQMANSVHFGQYNPGHEYFTFNGYGNIETIPKYQLSDYIDGVEITNYILENDIDFDNNDIRYILDDIEEDSEQ